MPTCGQKSLHNKTQSIIRTEIDSSTHAYYTPIHARINLLFTKRVYVYALYIPYPPYTLARNSDEVAACAHRIALCVFDGFGAKDVMCSDALGVVVDVKQCICGAVCDRCIVVLAHTWHRICSRRRLASCAPVSRRGRVSSSVCGPRLCVRALATRALCCCRKVNFQWYLRYV